ncbi:MAG TPA: hypothetical protein VNU26_03770, partial [Mycobacteriales bacterium]|nr:hypothetical protein [Mycobacteriales bacterium]
TTLASDDETVPFAQPVGPGGFVRAEVRGESEIFPDRPTASRMDMEALTNPVWLAVGEPPAGTTPDPTQPPAAAGPRRGGRQDPAPAAAPSAAETRASTTLPATGAPAAVAVAGAAALAGAAVARRMTMTEFRFRHSAGLEDDGPVTLVGQVTGADGDGLTLSRWVPGCCSADAPVDVRVAGASAAVGDWLEVTGSRDGDVLRAESARPVDDPPPAREA